jgi:hypothetical protein
LIGSFWLQVGVCILAAAALRLAFLIRAQGMLDGDEAVLGIQAQSILRGAHPTYFPSQAYMGTWDAYLLAPLVALFGPSAWTVHAVTLGESLLLVPLAGVLATQLYGRRARLPAMLVTALAPLYVAVGELRMLGGYVETLVLGTALMLQATRVADAWARGRSTRQHWVWIGLILGVGMWIDPLIVYYVGATALWLAPFAYLALRRLRPGASLRPAILNAVLFGTIGLLGFFPGLIHAVHNHWDNVKYILHGGESQAINQASQSASAAPPWLGGLWVFTQQVVPWLTGSHLLWDTSLPAALIPLGVVLAALAVATPIVFAALRLAQRPRTGRHVRWAWARLFPLLLLAVVASIYAWSPTANAALVPVALTARYALPATTGLSLALAGWFTDLPALLRLIARRVHRRFPVASIPSFLGRLLLGAVLSLVLLANTIPYFTANAVVAIQSPYRPRDLYPAVDANLLTYLRQQRIRLIWTTHWIGNVIMFQSGERIIAADMLYHDRFPEDVQILLAADRPSYLIEADPSQGECALARALDAMRITYTAVPFQHWWIITPLSRTVYPTEIQPAILPDYYH